MRFLTILFVFFLAGNLLFAQAPATIDLNKIDYHQWDKIKLSEEASVGNDIGDLYLVTDLRPEYKENLEKEKQNLETYLKSHQQSKNSVKAEGAERDRTGYKYNLGHATSLQGAIFKPRGNLQWVIVVYDRDGQTELLAVYVEDEGALESFGSLKMFYRQNDRWEQIPPEISILGPSPLLFYFVYEKTGKLIFYRQP